MNTLRLIFAIYAFFAKILELICEPQPLLLTPLINSGRLDEARNLSVVEPFVDDIKSYAGYFTVDNVTQSHLYFWFFPCTNVSRKSAPVILWLSGGPGITFLYGLFEENGPLEVANDGETIRRRKYAWTNNYQMLYIDQPIGAGFSFTQNETTGYIKTQEDVGEHLYEALLQFQKLFPEFKSNELFIGGESYAGKYVPAMAFKIQQVNRRAKKTVTAVAGLIITSGYSDPDNTLNYGRVLQKLGLIDKNDRKKLEAGQDEVKLKIQSKKWRLANWNRDTLFQFVLDMPNTTSIYDYILNHTLIHFPFLDFVAKNQTRERIHAYFGSQIEWMDLKFEEDMLRSVRGWIAKLLENHRILFFNGNHDILTAHTLTENFLENLRWGGASKYAEAKRQLWFEDDVAVGYYKVADNLIDALVFNSGHSESIRQPKNVLRLIDMFVGKEFKDY